MRKCVTERERQWELKRVRYKEREDELECIEYNRNGASNVYAYDVSDCCKF